MTSQRKLGVLGKALLLRFLPVLACLVITGIVALVFLHSVDLKPQVGENFFFSKDDPQVRADNDISDGSGIRHDDAGDHTGRRCVYTFAEYETMFRNAGFGSSQVHAS